MARIKHSGSWQWFIVVPLLPVLLVIIILQVVVQLILTIPYRLLFPSANWGLFSSRDIEPVRVYLEHFRQLHPELIQYYATTMHSRNRSEVFEKIRYWPSKSERTAGTILPICLGGGHKTSYEFTWEAAFFACLEAADYPRETIWRFLMEEVERHVALPDSTKMEYRRVMQLMNTCRLETVLKVFEWLRDAILDILPSNDYVMPAPEAVPAGLQAVGVRNWELHWFLARGQLIVPLDDDARTQLERWIRWGALAALPKPGELEKGLPQDRWAIMDSR